MDPDPQHLLEQHQVPPKPLENMHPDISWGDEDIDTYCMFLRIVKFQSSLLASIQKLTDPLCSSGSTVIIKSSNTTKRFFLYRYLFHLSRLENQNCPNEAEFRAYDILLNLNEGDTLR